MEQNGKEYFGNCPLHTDKTPSFSITPDKNMFYCFSCGRGGGIVKYLMEYESLDFDNAVEKASKLASFDLSKICQSETVKINRDLRNSKRTKDKIIHSILDKSILEKYKKDVIDEWLDEGIRQEEIDLFGVRIDDKGNRIIYPVYDINGNLINIKGRTRYKNYKKLRIEKYINYYKIGTMDYFQGLNITLPYIQESGEIKIFESIKSVMKLMRYGVKDSASAEKHTLTDEQIRLLIRLRKDVVFCYDSDVSYKEKRVKENIDTLKRYLNVYIIEEFDNLLGGEEAKNSPIDCGIDIWDKLYANKKKIV